MALNGIYLHDILLPLVTIVAMVTCSIIRDKSLIDEEDELLYGDGGITVKKEEIKS